MYRVKLSNVFMHGCLVVLTILILSACNTLPMGFSLPEDQQAQVLQVQDLRIELVFLSQDELIRRHGTNTAIRQKNPYIEFPSKLSPRRFIIYSMKASTEQSTVNFELDKIFLGFGSREGDAKSRQYLRVIWGQYGGDDKTMNRVMKQTILDKKFTVSPGNPVEGYLVFAEAYPVEGGEGQITFYVNTPEGDEGVLELPVDIINPALISPQSENQSGTGLFATEPEPESDTDAEASE